MFSSLFAISGLVTLLASFTAVSATARGLAWAYDDNFAPVIGSKPMVKWYHHWQDGPVDALSKVGLEYVPMFWGTKKWDLWNQRKSEMNKKLPKNLLGFNEPDINSQSNMDPNTAAQVWMQEIHPWAAKGVKLGSPAIAYNIDWMKQFLAALKAKGGHVDFITCHWYGSWNDIAGFKKFIQNVHANFGKDIWVTELGVTSASNPTQQQAKNFMMQAYSWMDSQGYVARASWFGCFEASNPPDSYATGKNALYKSGPQLSDMGFWYGYTSQPDRRELRTRHHYIAARNNITPTVEEAEDAVHCDEICKLRNEQLVDIPEVEN